MRGPQAGEATLSNTIKHSLVLFQQLKLPLLLTAFGWIGLTKLVQYIVGLITVGYAAPVLGLVEMVVEPVLLFGLARLCFDTLTGKHGFNTVGVGEDVRQAIFSGFTQGRVWAFAASYFLLVIPWVLVIVVLLFFLILVPGLVAFLDPIIQILTVPLETVSHLAVVLLAIGPIGTWKAWGRSLKLSFRHILICMFAFSCLKLFNAIAVYTVLIGLITWPLMITYAAVAVWLLQAAGKDADLIEMDQALAA